MIIGLAAATSAIAALLLGRVGDQIGHRKILLFSTVALFGLYLPQYFVTNYYQLMILQAAGGAAMGGALAAVAALLAEMSPENYLGVTYGINASAVSMASALGSVLGAGVAVAMGLRAPFLVASVVFALTVIIVLMFLPKFQPTHLLVKNQLKR